MQANQLMCKYEEDFKNVSSSRKDVTVCFKLDDRHVTATYLGDAPSEETFGALYSFMTCFNNQSVQVEVVGKDQFGPKQDIDVVLVKFVDEATQQKVIAFHQMYGKPEPGWNKKLDTPNFHISAKHREWFENTDIGTILSMQTIAAKRLGPVDPFYWVGLCAPTTQHHKQSEQNVDLLSVDGANSVTC